MLKQRLHRGLSGNFSYPGLHELGWWVRELGAGGGVEGFIPTHPTGETRCAVGPKAIHVLDATIGESVCLQQGESGVAQLGGVIFYVEPDGAGADLRVVSGADGHEVIGWGRWLLLGYDRRLWSWRGLDYDGDRAGGIVG